MNTIFIGGGTPSALSPAVLSRLLEQVDNTFQIYSNAEKTMEANPESLSADHIRVLREFQFNRVSLGVQSFQDLELRKLGRLHTACDAKNTIALLQTAGFSNINIDLMFGIPGQTQASWLSTLNQAIASAVPHVSAYSLSIEEGSRFYQTNQESVGDSADLAFYRTLQRMLRKNGYCQYEVSAFAKPKFQCQHNRAYWTFQDYIGLGPSAHSFWQNKRFAHPKDFNTYLRSPLPRISRGQISRRRLMTEYMICQLRLLDGICRMDAEKRLCVDLVDYFKPQLAELTRAKLVRVTPTHIRVTVKGLVMLDTVLAELI